MDAGGESALQRGHARRAADPRAGTAGRAHPRDGPAGGAERLAAGPGEEAYGAASVRVAYHATASVVGKVPPTVFLPQPAVDSGLVELIRRPTPAVDPQLVSEEEIFVLVKAAFGQRRKMLRRSLASLLTPEAFAQAGVEPTQRPEELDVTAFGRLAAAR